MRVGRRHYTRHDVVVVPAAEVLVLQKGAVVQVGVEVGGERSVEHPVDAVQDGIASSGNISKGLTWIIVYMVVKLC